jgi:hypothetical protein
MSFWILAGAVLLAFLLLFLTPGIPDEAVVLIIGAGVAMSTKR